MTEKPEKYSLSSEINLNEKASPRVMEIDFISEDSSVLNVGCADGGTGAALKKYELILADARKEKSEIVKSLNDSIKEYRDKLLFEYEKRKRSERKIFYYRLL